MSQLFFKAFGELKAPDNIYNEFEEVNVERIVASNSDNKLLIYVKSPHILRKNDIRTMNKLLSKKLFNTGTCNVNIIENYCFAGTYPFEKIFEQYKDNIADIMNLEGSITLSVYNSSDVFFEDGKLVVDTIDNFIAIEKSKHIKEVLESIFNETFDYNISVELRHTKKPKKVEHKVPVSYAAHNMGQDNNNGGVPSDYGMLPDDLPPLEDIEIPAGYEEELPPPPVMPVESKDAKSSGGDVADKESKDKKNGGDNNEKQSVYNKAKKNYKKLPDDPDIFYGRAFEGDSIPIADIQDEIGEVVVVGKIISVEVKEIKNEKAIIMFSITDFTDSIKVKMFVHQEETQELSADIAKGKFVMLKGIAMYDKFDREISIGGIRGIKRTSNFVKQREDKSELKRVELHCHTKMSDMDAVSSAEDIVAMAGKWGHRAIAITDHGCVQAFPDAYKARVDKDFKIIYGVEAYLVDDIKEVVVNSKGQPLTDTFVVFDIETTGFGPKNDHIIEIGAVKVKDGQILDRFSTFINPQIPIPANITKLTSITDQMVADADTIDVVLPKFIDFLGDCPVVAHNAGFDTGFITTKAMDVMNYKTEYTIVDTLSMARLMLPGLKNYKLDVVAEELDCVLESHHRAVDDAECTAHIFMKLVKMLQEKGHTNLDSLNNMDKLSNDIVRKMHAYHAIILAKNLVGRINLYKLVSESHINYFSRRPKIPKSLYLENCEGLIIGSACEAGELYRAILEGQPNDEIARLVNFYDYLEIQPVGNNMFMIDNPKITAVNSVEDIKEINKKIVKLGEEFNKPVVATCDVHFLNPEDSIYRSILMDDKFDDADNQPPLYLRTTEEMLAEFDYLGADKAREVVIDNTNMIADCIENMPPVRPDKCPPVIENSDGELRRICYEKAVSMYGENLPPQVKNRLDHELNSIINNGFAVMYIIAQKLVWKSVEDGYLVGSRGSVGSSFVATMSGITEVNPLPAHYYCKKCHYSDFDSDEVKQYAGRSGFDMPDKACPVCGENLAKDGHDIPFETFLGFYGDKEPDIDLNFSGEYQCMAHAYTEVIFGEGQTFRAGTITGVAEKTAYGYTKGYYERRETHKRSCEIERIAKGCEGVKRSTGQHPGGIVVLPIGEEIYSFTPVQRPANDMTTSTVTTHFDYHKIDHNLLKLDILGHDDPTIIRMLEDITGVSAMNLPFDDPQVYSLFENDSALNLKLGKLMDCDLGSLGIPELGTKFVMQMLKDTKPKNFSDLVRISGLSHGTDVWLNNAQYYIANGDCTLPTAICTRDDIMIYLIQMGVEDGLAFKIMESVRKGKGLKPEMEEAMRAANVPEWYLESCKKIKYMFPKAHAVAYIMMAIRIAWFKVHIPLAYYAAYFSIRAKAFDYELMCLGLERVESWMNDYKARKASAKVNPAKAPSKKEDDVFEDMKIVQEMYLRGFEFEPIDIFKAQAHRFQIVGDKLMPSFDSIDGLGDKASDSVVEGVKGGPFLSKEDFKNRCKITQTAADTMGRLGLLGDIPESNQISLMDLFAI